MYSKSGARAISGIRAGRYDPGSGPIYFDGVRCAGSEPALVNCSSGGRGVHNCDHSEDAGVSCEGVYEKQINSHMHTHTHTHTHTHNTRSDHDNF